MSRNQLLDDNQSDDVRDAISEQEEELARVRGEETDGTTLFMISLLELEMDRFRFLLRSYLRCRVQKVQKFNQYLLSAPERISLMSEEELKFCKEYTDMMQAHYNACFLNKVPATLQKLDEMKLTVQPPINNHVFVRVLEDLGNVQMGDVDEVELSKDEIAIVKYSHVDHFITSEKMELV